MRQVRQIQRFDARSSVNVLRVVNDQVLAESHGYLVVDILGHESGHRGVAVCHTVTETETLGGGQAEGAGVAGELVGEIDREGVSAVSTGTIERVQERETVSNDVGAVSEARALERVEIVAALLDERQNVFIFAVLVVDSFAPFVHKLIVYDL
ncbi:hypothetical protein IMSAGC006_01621 [Muribaculaceae bacterium]|nr:hypothetical protein IMSAGC006_01621 [Muribaculaceae bacterium]